ncbi:MAG: tRNA pseudouridine38-40 synthase [Candidatus Sumerlaeota bacterium]|nr:tRNA pseudouridine38-40 synthase [Candidatus Sumerlaeota bacterium]
MTSDSPTGTAKVVVLPRQPLMRVAAIVEYDGTGFAGLQRQVGQPSIQACFEKMAAAFGVRDAGFRAAGRTDAGVNARGQVIAIHIPETIRGKNLISAMNWHLPESIRVRRAEIVGPDFDPRIDARLRTYRYHLCGGQAFPPLMRGRMGRVRAHLDLDLMREAAQVLQGQHDFKAWRSTMCQAKRTLLDLVHVSVEPWRDAGPHGMDTQCFQLEFSCRSFLHRMVRYLVGGIARAGAGDLTPDDLRAHLKAGTLPPRVAPADANGLSLERVEYLPEKDPFRGPPSCV